VENTAIPQAKTAVRSVDIVKTDTSGKPIGGGAVTIKGPSAWQGGGSASYVSGGGATAREVKTFAETNKIVDQEVGAPLSVQQQTYSVRGLQPREKIYSRYTATEDNPYYNLRWEGAKPKGIYEIEAYRQERERIIWGQESAMLKAEAAYQYDINTTKYNFEKNPASFAGMAGFSSVEKEGTITYTLNEDYIKSLPSYSNYQTAMTGVNAFLSTPESDIHKVALSRAKEQWRGESMGYQLKSTFSEYGIGVGKFAIGMGEFGVTVWKNMGVQTFKEGEKRSVWGEGFKFGGSIGKFKQTPTVQPYYKYTEHPLLYSKELLDRPAAVAQIGGYGSVIGTSIYSGTKGFLAGQKAFGTTAALKQTAFNLSPLRPSSSLFIYPTSEDTKVVGISRTYTSGDTGTRTILARGVENPDLQIISTQQFKLLGEGKYSFGRGTTTITSPSYYYYGGDLYRGRFVSKSAIIPIVKGGYYGKYVYQPPSGTGVRFTGMQGSQAATAIRPMYSFSLFEGSQGFVAFGSSGGPSTVSRALGVSASFDDRSYYLGGKYSSSGKAVPTTFIFDTKVMPADFGGSIVSSSSRGTSRLFPELFSAQASAMGGSMAASGSANLPIIKTSGGLELASLLYINQKEQTRQKTSMITTSGLRFMPLSRQETITIPKVDNRLFEGLSLSQAQSSYSPQKFKEIAISIPASPAFSFPGFGGLGLAAGGVGKFALFDLPSMDLSGGLGTGILGGRNILRYTPSYQAIKLNIKGRKTSPMFGGKFSGFELRKIAKGEFPFKKGL